MKTVALSPAFFNGQISLEEGDGWVHPWRIPHTERDLFPSPENALLDRASCSAGVRLRFSTEATVVGVRCVQIFNWGGTFDLTIGDELVQTAALKGDETEVIFADLPAGPKVLTIWLPVHPPLRYGALLLEDGFEAIPLPDRRPRWVTYGSSITQCAACHSPARTWPATVARACGWNLTCLGFGGQCHIDSMIARMIRDLPADLISLKLGINVYSINSLGPRALRAAMIGFVKIVRERHETTPLVLASPICSPEREETVNDGGYTLAEMRAEVRDVCDRLKAAGDDNLYYIDGLDLIGAADADQAMPVDRIHPDGDGYELLGRNFLEQMPLAFRAFRA